MDLINNGVSRLINSIWESLKTIKSIFQFNCVLSLMYIVLLGSERCKCC